MKEVLLIYFQIPSLAGASCMFLRQPDLLTLIASGAWTAGTRGEGELQPLYSLMIGKYFAQPLDGKQFPHLIPTTWVNNLHSIELSIQSLMSRVKLVS